MKKILIIDDQKDNLTSIGALLKSYIPDCEILTALSGQKGIDIAVNDQPDTILLDIIMPEMDGYETCRKLKENTSTKHIPIIMLTAIKTDPASRVKGLNFGADAFLSKPIESSELTAQVKVMFRIKEAEDKLREERDLLDEKVKERTEELSKSEEKYRGVVDDMPVLICCFLPMGEITFVNKNYCDYFSKTSEELVGSNFKSFVPESEVESVMTSVSALTVESPTRSQEHRVTVAGGDVRWQHWTNRALFDSQGNIVSYQAIGEDITDRKHAEKKVEEQNEFLNTVLESLTHPFLVVNAQNYTIEMANSASGCNSGDEKPTCHSLTHHNDKPCQEPEHKCPLRIIKKTKKPTIVQHIHFDKEGNKRNVEVHGFPILDTNGNVIRMIEYCLDITERKQAEDALRNSEERLRTFFEQGLLGMAITSVDKGWIEVNDCLCEMLGYSLDELSNMTWAELTYPEDLEPDLLQFRRILTGEINSYYIEKRFVHKNGKIVCTALSINALKKSEDGSIDCFLALIHDITNLKKTEDDLKKKLNELQIFYDATVDREIKMLELKKEINELLEKKGDGAKYEIPV